MKLHELLEQSAGHRPDHGAIEDPERAVDISYRDLNGLADYVKESLLQAGVRPGDRVGLFPNPSGRSSPSSAF